MFQTFVIGPVGIGRLGLIRRCVECRERGAARDAQCSGFGAGCLTRPREEKKPGYGFTYASLLDIDPRLGGF